jgi:DNA-binding NarL/FixJ family response regulator
LSLILATFLFAARGLFFGMSLEQLACQEKEVLAVPINVSIVEDDPGLRDGLARLLNLTHEFRCVAQYSDGETAMNEIPRLKPDVVLMDINLPGMSGLECVQRLHVIAPGLHIVMLTVYEDPDQIFKALTFGAIGYLLKQCPSVDLLEAIRDAHRGGSPISSQIARKIVQFFQTGGQADVGSPMSAREAEVLKLLSKGHLVKEIADQMGLSYLTVRTYIRRIYEKLQVHSRSQAVAKFFRPPR